MFNFRILILLFIILSCNNPHKERAFNEDNLVTPVDFGEYHYLLDDKMKIFLPQGFKKLSESEIREFIDSIQDEEHRYYYEKSYEQRKFLRGNSYEFYNDEYSGEVIVTTMRHMPFDKSSAGQLLYFIRKSHEEYQKVTGIQHHKVSAKYFGDRSLQVFKAIYTLTHSDQNISQVHEEELKIFKTVYVISSNKKTFVLNFLTPFDIDLDPFIKKIKFI